VTRRLSPPSPAYSSRCSRGKLRDSARSQVQQVEDRDTGELTDNYALYLGAAERGGQGKIASALLGTNKENDRKLLEALDDL